MSDIRPYNFIFLGENIIHIMVNLRYPLDHVDFRVPLTVGLAGFIICSQVISISTGALNVALDHFAKVLATTIFVLTELWNNCKETEGTVKSVVLTTHPIFQTVHRRHDLMIWQNPGVCSMTSLNSMF